MIAKFEHPEADVGGSAHPGGRMPEAGPLLCIRQVNADHSYTVVGTASVSLTSTDFYNLRVLAPKDQTGSGQGIDNEQIASRTLPEQFVSVFSVFFVPSVVKKA